MEILIIIGSILVILGVIGSIAPALPGPIFSFAGLVALFFAKGSGTISVFSLALFGLTMIILSIINYAAPILGAKYFGATKKGVWGAALGAILGLVFFPPLGILVGALVGAVVGEVYSGKKLEAALRSGLGVLLGSVTETILQIIYSLVVAGYFFFKVF